MCTSGQCVNESLICNLIHGCSNAIDFNNCCESASGCRILSDTMSDSEGGVVKSIQGRVEGAVLAVSTEFRAEPPDARRFLSILSSILRFIVQAAEDLIHI